MTLLDPKRNPQTKVWIPTPNEKQICSGLNLSRTEARGQGHNDLEKVGDTPRSKMNPQIKFWIAAKIL